MAENEIGKKTKALWENPDYRRHMSEVHKGIKTSEKQKQVARELLINKNPMKNEKSRLKISGKNSHLWKGGISKQKGYANRLYGDDWNNIRNFVLNRDNYTCQRCFKYGGLLHIHHKIPFFISLDNSINNLKTLCPKCHRIEEREYYE